MKVTTGSVSHQHSSAPVTSGPVAQAPRPEKCRAKPRDSSVRDYHNEALNRCDQMASSPSQQPQSAQEAADAAKAMRDTLSEWMKSFMEQWKIQHEGSTTAGTTALGQMKANSDSLGKVMQAWAQMMYGGGG